MKIFRQIGLIIGIIILAACAVGGLGYMTFQGPIRQEKARLFKKTDQHAFQAAHLDSVPLVLKSFLQIVQADQDLGSIQVQFSQQGKIWNSPDEAPRDFTATQYTSASSPGFVWQASLFPIFVRDKFLDNNGEMWVTVLGLGNIHRSSSAEVDQGSLMRYLGELVWAPAGFRDKRIHWEVVGEQQLTATLWVGETTASCTFEFGEDGFIQRIFGKRYHEELDGSFQLMDWEATCSNYQKFEGVWVPTKAEVAWILPSGTRFVYFQAEISDWKPVN